MTDQQPHAPTTGFIQSRYEAGRLALDGADTARLTTAERSAEFDRWLAAHDAEVAAAAEQRGAVRAWDEAIDYAWDDSSIYQADAARAKSKNPYRADLLEGDDG